MNPLTEFWVHPDRDPQVMWESWKDPHRQQAIATIGRLDVNTVYEIGCGSGPNLRLLREKYPKLYLAGGEPNKRLRGWANEYFPVDDLTLPDVPGGNYDCILSMYALAYVQDAGRVLKDLYDFGNKYLVLIEPSAHEYPFGKPGLYEGHAMTSFVHDYRVLGEQAGWRTLWRWPIVPHHHGLNVTLVMERS